MASLMGRIVAIVGFFFSAITLIAAIACLSLGMFPYFVFFAFFGVVLFLFSLRMWKLAKNAKTGDAIDVAVYEGLPNMQLGDIVRISHASEGLQINNLIRKKSAFLGYDKIANCGEFKRIELEKILKSNVGKSVVNGLLFGSLAMYFTLQKPNEKTVSTSRKFIVINYLDNYGVTSALTFESVGATMGTKAFINQLKEKACIVDYQSPAPHDNIFEHIDL